MSEFQFPAPATPAVPVAGSDRYYAVQRIFCVRRNYAAHAREMGGDPDREPPFYFTKAPAAPVASGSEIPYPPGRANFHHEIELVVAIGAEGHAVDTSDALDLVYGYAAGLDMTRHDLQIAARDKGRPWSIGKDIECGAVIGALQPAADIGHPATGRIWLDVNGETRQESDLFELIWSVPEVIAHLSGYYHLAPGDLIYTGTPEGVGPVVDGDRLGGGVDGVAEIELSIGPADSR